MCSTRQVQRSKSKESGPMTTSATTPIELFYSYAHTDEPLRKELEKHLSLLKRQGYLAGWHDRDIGKASTPSLDLELDWWDLFRDRERLPSEEEWREVLFPALQDVKHALSETSVSQQVHVSVQAILPAAFGFAFPASSSFTLLLQSNQGIWSTKGTTASSSALHRLSYNEDGDKQVAVIEIAITSST